MKPLIDPGSRMVLEEAPTLPTPPSSSAGRGFVELCARTTFSGVTIEGFGVVEGRSTLDARAAWPGAGLPEEVVARAAVLEQDVIAIADLDTVAGVVRAHSAGLERDVRVIPGCELLLDEGSLVLLPMTPLGWANLCAILTIAKDGTLLRGIEKDDIEHRLDVVCAHAKDLQAIVFPPFHPQTATAAITALQAAFGDRLSLGLSFQQVPDDVVAAAFVQTWHEQLGIAVLVSARPVLVDEDDGAFHDVLTAIRQHQRVDSGGQRWLPNRRARLRTEVEITELITTRARELQLPSSLSSDEAVAAMVARTRTVADACTFQLGQIKYVFPVEHDDENAVLREHTFVGAHERYPHGIPEAIVKQLDHELALIQTINVAAYFLTVEEIVVIAREKGILCQGRGSAANSAVCYCLGITSVNPAESSLLFERFISVERAEPPDIDVDFEHERREEIIQAIYARWGRNHAAMICEVISYRGPSAVRDVGKAHGLSDVVTGRISELMIHGSFSELLGGSRFASAKTDRRADLKTLAASVGLDVDDPAIMRTLLMSLRLQRHPRHLGIHVGGFVLTRHPITTLAPVEPARMADRAVLPFDKDDVETLGLFKMDVLGLGMLTCIRKAFDLVNAELPSSSTPWALHTIPADDSDVYDAICRADTVGVFQIESRAQMQMLPRLRPRRFYDLVVQVAIVRPGPIQGGMVHPYLRRRQGLEEVDYPHPCLIPTLERTLGVPLFQEQVMKLAIDGAGYTPGQADQLRRDMAAWKKTGRLERHRDRLIDGFVENGIDTKFAERLYEQVKGFGEYGFPESHAASFANLVYASSWLKHHHPAHFACALLNSLPMGFYAPAQIVKDVQQHGIAVRPVDITRSRWDCTLERDDDDTASSPPALRLGLRLIKGLNEAVARAVVADRDADGDFVDIADVVRRGRLDKRARLALARSGAFDPLAGHRRAAMWAAMDTRPPLFARLPDEQPSLFPPSDGEVLLLDYANVGLSVDDHPMLHLRPRLLEHLARRQRARQPQLFDSRDVRDKSRHKSRVLVAGLVIGRQRPGTADGTCFVTLEDEFGHINVVVWGRDFERWRSVIVTSRFLLFDAVIERAGIVIHAMARAVMAVSATSGDFIDSTDGDAGNGKRQIALPFASRDFH